MNAFWRWISGLPFVILWILSRKRPMNFRKDPGVEVEPGEVADGLYETLTAAYKDNLVFNREYEREKFRITIPGIGQRFIVTVTKDPT